LRLRGFVSPPIGEALAGDAIKHHRHAGGVVHAEAGAVRVAEIELREVARQVRL
jgi:hypothetical protein